jgi:hypothetical protein
VSVTSIIWQVVAYDWDEVIAEFEERPTAVTMADNLDGLAVRCYVRPARGTVRETGE